MLLLVYFLFTVFAIVPFSVTASKLSTQRTIHSRFDLHTYIHSETSQSFSFNTDLGIPFSVYLVKNSSQKSLNPNFPSIHINSSHETNAWLHMVYTDSDLPKYQNFIDADPNNYPFYTNGVDFYDAPLWTYSENHRPFTFWEGHAFALVVNHERKIIQCLGGIGWGFKLPPTMHVPLAMTPSCYPILHGNMLGRRISRRRYPIIFC